MGLITELQLVPKARALAGGRRRVVAGEGRGRGVGGDAAFGCPMFLPHVSNPLHPKMRRGRTGAVRLLGRVWVVRLPDCVWVPHVPTPCFEPASS